MQGGDISNEALSPIRVAVVWEAVVATDDSPSRRWRGDRPPQKRAWRTAPITIRSINRLARNNVPVDVWTFLGDDDWAEHLLDHLRDLSVQVANVRYYSDVTEAVADISLGTYKVVYDSDHDRLERYGWAGRFVGRGTELPALV